MSQRAPQDIACFFLHRAVMLGGAKTQASFQAVVKITYGYAAQYALAFSAIKLITDDFRYNRLIRSCPL